MINVLLTTIALKHCHGDFKIYKLIQPHCHNKFYSSLFLITYSQKEEFRTPILKYQKLVEDAFAPIKATPQAAGFDLRSIEDYIIPPQSIQIVRTGIKIELPTGCYGRIAPRSGLAVKYFIDVGGNIINVM